MIGRPGGRQLKVDVMAGNAAIDILLATYNGAPYLDAQLQSILSQSHTGWRLLIRDDNSTDTTPDIIARFAVAHPGRVEIIQDDKPHGSARVNFAALLDASTADYCMYCDQDDVWLPDKIAATFAAMHQMEDRHGRDMPVMAHCDLRVVDSQLRELYPSLWGYQRLNPTVGESLNRALLQNVSVGCAAMFNRALRQCAAPVPETARGHDWWVSLVAAALGKIAHVPEPLVLYRQHANNAVGATQWTLGGLARNFAASGPGFIGAKKAILRGTQRQAAALLDRHGDAMRAADRQMLARFATLSERNAITRRLDVLRHGFYFEGALKNIGMFVLI